MPSSFEFLPGKSHLRQAVPPSPGPRVYGAPLTATLPGQAGQVVNAIWYQWRLRLIWEYIKCEILCCEAAPLATWGVMSDKGRLVLGGEDKTPSSLLLPLRSNYFMSPRRSYLSFLLLYFSLTHRHFFCLSSIFSFLVLFISSFVLFYSGLTFF